jgi:endonuclease G
VAFLTPEVKRLKNRVLVPSHFFKAVYLPSQHQAMAFFSPNDDSGTVEKISLSTLKKRTGVNAFPSLPSNVATIAP